jgi:hypothetical protein
MNTPHTTLFDVVTDQGHRASNAEPTRPVNTGQLAGDSPADALCAGGEATGLTVKRCTVSAFQLGRKALVYLFKCLCSIIVARALEAAIAALFAVMAGVSWPVGIAVVLGKILH